MKKILLVEDDDFIRDLVFIKLSKAGYEIITERDGAQVIETVQKEVPDLILLDLDLPLKHGFDILKDLRATNESSKIPVIIYSNSDSLETQHKAEEFTATDYYFKASTDPNELIEKINKILA